MLRGYDPTLSAIKGKLRWNEFRHRTIASNVANINTPDFKAKSVPHPGFSAFLRSGVGSASGINLASTNDNHLPAGAAANSNFRARNSESWEITASGNEVVSEEQMVKLSENATDFQISVTLFTRSLAMLRSALDRG